MKTKTLAMKTQRPHSLKILAVSLWLSVIASSAQETGSLPTVTMAANNSAPGQDLFVSEANGSVAKISPDGAQSIFAAGMKRPLGLAVDRAGNLFVADGFSATIYKFTPDGAGSAFATNIYSPFALAFDSAGNLFATDDDGSVYVFTPDGARSLFASGMQHTSALAFDSAGNLFVTDSGSASNDAHIYKFTPVGAGSPFASGLDESYGLASNSAGALFYSDYLTGDTGAALTVYFTIGGTATSGSDYQPLGDSVSIPAGAVSADVVVQPIDDSEAEGTETVVLTLYPDCAHEAYKIGEPANATVTI